MLKRCGHCKKDLDISLFRKYSKRKDGLQNYCIKCNISYQKKYQFKKYNITYLQAKQILKQQDYKCKICNKSIKKKGHLDHCHKTKKIRGYLCAHCNHGLGHFKDDINILNNAILYLQK